MSHHNRFQRLIHNTKGDINILGMIIITVVSAYVVLFVISVIFESSEIDKTTPRKGCRISLGIKSFIGETTGTIKPSVTACVAEEEIITDTDTDVILSTIADDLTHGCKWKLGGGVEANLFSNTRFSEALPSIISSTRDCFICTHLLVEERVDITYGQLYKYLSETTNKQLSTKEVPYTHLSYLEHGESLALFKVFDEQGNEVQRFSDTVLKQGTYSVVFVSKRENGELNGIYLGPTEPIIAICQKGDAVTPKGLL